MGIFKRNSIIIFLIFGSSLLAQEADYSIAKEDSIKVKHLAIGAKIGIPSIVGGSVEVVLPFLNNHIAPYIYYSTFSLDFENIETNLTALEYGAKYYFGEKGSGFFISVGRGSLETELTFNDLLYTNNDTQQSFQGSGATSFKLNTSNFKVGIKTPGTFYFLFELGYGVGEIPKELNFTAQSNGITESFTEEIPALPGIGSNGILLGNVGFGIAF